MDAASGWQFWIDRGGTFTDVIGRAPDGSLRVAKLLSDNPGRYADAALQGIRDLLGLGPDEGLPAERIAGVTMGTTVATNALLERKGERTTLVLNPGLAGLLQIGTQQRPRLFDLAIRLPEPLYEEIIEVPGRLSAHGDELQALNLEVARRRFEDARRRGIGALAIVGMHGCRHPRHERALAALAREVGFAQVTASHEAGGLIGIVSRGGTAVADAYLTPGLRRYVGRLRDALGEVPLRFMTSSGGLTGAERFAGRHAILSGPAGGAVGAAIAGEAAGAAGILAFDMGGTSTDVSHHDGGFARRSETVVGGVRVAVPAVDVHTVAAGGGSVVSYDGGRLRVGPASAGANPGPACYGRGGPLTVTDCNLLLGRISDRDFPRVFGPAGNSGLDRSASEAGFAALAAAVGGKTPEELASGALRIAVENVVRAIRNVSVGRGREIGGHTLVAFGGAAGQVACLVAEALGLERVAVHPLAGVLSAYGVGHADVRALREVSVEVPLDDDGWARAQAASDGLEREVTDELTEQGAAVDGVRRTVRLRYQGTNTALDLPWPAECGTLATAYHDGHRAAFGFALPRAPLVIAAVVAEAVSRRQEPMPRHVPAGATEATDGRTRAYFGVGWREVPVRPRSRLHPGGRTLAGPAVVVEGTTTVVVDPGWEAGCDGVGNLILTRTGERRGSAPATEADRGRADPVLLELFNNLFGSVAEQMGVVLQGAAHSVNIKERLDFSCAVFDAEARLVANAPHVPVHLGSMGEAVRAIRDRFGGTLQAGDAYAINDPFSGGTHLPDLTVVTPVFLGGKVPSFWVASRGHHADVGGLTPGSMPARSRCLEEEGVCIPGMLLVRAGEFLEGDFRRALAGTPRPARNPDANVGDVQAQIAANAKGDRELARAVAKFGLATVTAYMGHVRENAAEHVRRVLTRLRPGSFRLSLDGGATVVVRVEVDGVGRRALVDFTGSSPQLADNFNAPSAIVRAAVLYAFRTLVGEEIPLNEGCLDAITIKIPPGSMLAPRAPAAVVAGNVETSQAIVNALFGALGVLAAGQGTMNNLTFGNGRHQYYETLGGGAGAGDGFPGASAVHTHMTNSRLTDAEVLETRYPVVLECFEVRPGSGGAGKYPGGDGLLRQIRFLEGMTVSLLTNSRVVPPFGLAGGSPGATGRNVLLRSNAPAETLPSCAEVALRSGDAIRLETPGGGGFGAADAGKKAE